MSYGQFKEDTVEGTHSESTVHYVHRSYPAELSISIAVLAIVPAKAVVVTWLPATCAGIPESTAAAVMELALLVAGAALCGHVAQYMSKGPRLRYWRICAAALLFDLLLACCFPWVWGGM